MIIIHNFITLCKYLINNTWNFKSVECIDFEDINNDDDDVEVPCYCNLCYVTRNIILFATRRLKIIKN